MSLIAIAVLVTSLGAPPGAATAASRQGTAQTPPVQSQTPPTDPQADPGQQGRAGRGAAGRGAGRGAQMPDPQVMGPNQVDQLFDTFMIFQAKPFLNLTEDQWLRFGRKLQTLQNLRRRVQRQRFQALTAMRELLKSPGVLDEAAVAEKLRAYDELVTQGTPETRQAYAEIDQILNLRQRLQFRVFEDTMERRKLELIAMARRNQQGRGDQPRPNSVKK